MRGGGYEGRGSGWGWVGVLGNLSGKCTRVARE